MFCIKKNPRFTVINMNDTPVPIGQMHSFHLYVEGYDSLYDMTNISLLYSYVSDLHHSRCQLKISGNSSRTHL